MPEVVHTPNTGSMWGRGIPHPLDTVLNVEYSVQADDFERFPEATRVISDSD